MDDILNEDMGVEFEFEFDGIPGFDNPVVSLTADDASVTTYGNALRVDDQQTGSGSLVGIAAAATSGRSARPCSRQSRSERRPQTTANLRCRPICDTTEIEEPYFGDLPGIERKDRFRIGCLNVNRISPFPEKNGRPSDTDAKHEELCALVKEMHLNVTLLQEIGVNWSKVPNTLRWKERTATQLDPTRLSHA